MAISTRGHEWGVVAQTDRRDYSYCALCNRYSDGEKYVRKSEIPQDARAVDSQEPFWRA